MRQTQEPAARADPRGVEVATGRGVSVSLGWGVPVGAGWGARTVVAGLDNCVAEGDWLFCPEDLWGAGAPTLARMVPASPTARHTLVLVQVMPYRLLPAPEAVLFQVLPPSLLLRTVPYAPTERHVLALGQVTPCRSLAVPEDRLRQEAPAPVPVPARIVPLTPTTRHPMPAAQVTP